MTDKKRKIGISQRITNAQNYVEKRDAISHDWAKFLEKIDLMPVFIPNSLTDIESFLDSFDLDGIILSGGDDLGTDIERDKTELDTLKFAIDKKIPVLGVCRGMQLINKFFGGSIVKSETSKHVGKNHLIKILDSKIYDILKTNSIEVNSYHNNLITKDVLAPSLLSIAVDETDDSIEGLHHEKHQILGVMWHPERSVSNDNEMILRHFFSTLDYEQ